MIRSTWKAAIFLLVLGLAGGCVSCARIDGPYEGKVIDAETRQPLKGAVALGVWNKYQLTVAGATGEFYDSIEVLTDENGHFKIKGLGLSLLSNVDEMDIMIFKAGYTYLGYGPWSSYKTLTGSKYVEWDGKKMTVPLRKISNEEMAKRIPNGPRLPDGKGKLLTREINIVRAWLGYQPIK